jgi:5-hydroxyisourate hydrolase
VTGRLTTHVLDIATGRPAAGIRIELFRIEGESRCRLADLVANADGRCDTPLMSGDKMRPGHYEIVFHVGAYHARMGDAVARDPFLDEVPVRFLLSDPMAHMHVPLLVAPYGYSTYWGS